MTTDENTRKLALLLINSLEHEIKDFKNSIDNKDCNGQHISDNFKQVSNSLEKIKVLTVVLSGESDFYKINQNI